MLIPVGHGATPGRPASRPPASSQLTGRAAPGSPFVASVASQPLSAIYLSQGEAA